MLSFLKLHFNLTGGRRIYLVLLFGIPGLIGLIAYLTYSAAMPDDYGQISSVWLMVVTGVHALLVLLAAPAALRKAIERDFTSGMIDSHRLMPRSNLALAMSYVLATPIQLLAVYLILLPCGLVFAFAIDAHYSLGSAALGGWLIIEANLISAGIMISALVAGMTLAGGGKTAIIGLMIAGFMFGGFFVVQFVPGLAVLTGALNLTLLSNALGSNSIDPNPGAVLGSMVSQGVFAVIFFLAASRRVRQSAWPMYSPGLALVFVLALSAVLSIGFAFAWGTTFFTPFQSGGDLPSRQLIASLGVFLLAANVPMSSAITEARVARTSSRRINYSILHQPLVIVVLVLMAGLLIPLSYGFFAADMDTLAATTPGLLLNANRLLIVLALAIAVALEFALLAIGMRLRVSPWFVSFFVLVALMLAPLLVESVTHELIRENVLPGITAPAPGMIAGFSPLGLIDNLLSGDGHIWTGFALLGVLLSVTIAVAAVLAPRRGQTRPPKNPPPPPALRQARPLTTPGS
jgi:hypothetical protein